MKKLLKILIIVIAALTVLCIFGVVIINFYVKKTAGKRIVSAEEAAKLEDIDCVIVPGCLVHSDNTLSGMLADRLRRGVELYDSGAAPKLLMSGDHGRKDYDEVNAMKAYAVAHGVPSEDVFMDHAGFSTYETIYRAKEIFGAKRVIIVTQEYHLYRALYIAERFGIEAYGTIRTAGRRRGICARSWRGARIILRQFSSRNRRISGRRSRSAATGT